MSFNKYKYPLIAALFLIAGCSHQLEILNMRDYTNLDIKPGLHKIKVGISSDQSDLTSSRLVKEVGTALQRNSYWVTLPYYPGGNQAVDAIANIEITPKFNGSPWNFLINWPGFLIWMPAIHGYNYSAEFLVDISLIDVANQRNVESWIIPIVLQMRHAEFDRTWTELGWFEWGFIPLIGGIVFINYDTDVTPLMLEKAERPLGDYIAQQIIDRLNGYGVGLPENGE